MVTFRELKIVGFQLDIEPLWFPFEVDLVKIDAFSLFNYSRLFYRVHPLILDLTQVSRYQKSAPVGLDFGR